jgi:3-oxoacyl-[acyl-carrier protein] reductase
MTLLEYKRALVAGGGGEGIGRGVVRAIAAAGAGVGIVDLDPQRATEAANEIMALSGSQWV